MSVSREHWKGLRKNDHVVKRAHDFSGKLLCGIPLTPGCIKNDFWYHNAQNHPLSLHFIKLKLCCSVLRDIQMYSCVYANDQCTDAAEQQPKCPSVHWLGSVRISIQS